MTLMAIIGELGVGKTLTLTALAVRHIIKYQGQRPIYTNYHLNTAALDAFLKASGQYFKYDWHYLDKPADFDMVRAGFFGGDELWVWADSRTSSSKMNRFSSQIMIKTRKRDMDVVYTAQTFGQIDKRIRKMTDLIAVPSLNERTGMAKVTILANHSFIPIKFLSFYAPYYYKIYDTTEEIAIPGDDDSK